MSYVCIHSSTTANKLLAAFYLCCLSATTLVVFWHTVFTLAQTVAYHCRLVCPDHFFQGRSIFRRQQLDRAVHFLPRTNYRVTAKPKSKSHAVQNGTKSPENDITPVGKSPTPMGKSPTPMGKSPTPDSSHTSSEDSCPSFSPPAKVMNIVRSSKFRHIQGGKMHRSTHIEKLPKLSVAILGESNAFQVRE